MVNLEVVAGQLCSRRQDVKAGVSKGGMVQVSRPLASTICHRRLQSIAHLKYVAPGKDWGRMIEVQRGPLQVGTKLLGAAHLM